MRLIKNFFKEIRNMHYIGNLNDGNRRDRRKARRIVKNGNGRVPQR